MNNPEIIVIHHSATKDGQVNDFNAIKNYHINTKGWTDIGYHWLIEYENNNVVVKKGRDEKTIGAHTLGYNEKSIGICVVGNFDVTAPSKEIIEMLKLLILDIYKRYGRLLIHYHCEFANKTCPGNMFYKKQLLQSEVDTMLEVSNRSKTWQEIELDKAIADGRINSPDYWLEKWDDEIKVKDVVGLVLKLTSK
jgi:N-acetyl-anhydromuramyl-L-alanine amidase AmpD